MSKHMQCIFALVVLTASAAQAQNAGLVPFTLPWNDHSVGPTDASSLNRTPLGAVTIGPDGHLMRDAQRLRLWGMNLAFPACFPTHAEADAVAARLAKLGFNAVRLHGCDHGYGGRTLIDYTRGNSRTLDEEMLDRFDYLTSALERRGIYVDVNLLVARRFLPDDAPAGAPLWPLAPLPPDGPYFDTEMMDLHKSLGFFFDPIFSAQQEYARMLLGHRNPYTGRTYAEDPGVVFVEIANETGLVHFWLTGGMSDYPAALQDELRRKWNLWLQDVAGYASTTALRAAWGLDQARVELLKNRTFAEPIAPWQVNVNAPAQATASVEPAADGGSPALRIDVTTAGTEGWHVQVMQPGLVLTAGETYTLAFRAKATGLSPIAYSLGRNASPWEWFHPWQPPTTLGSDWRDCSLSFLAPEAVTGVPDIRVEFNNFGLATGTLWLAQPSLLSGPEPLPAAQTLEAGTIPILLKPGTAGQAATSDWIRFLLDAEGSYWQRMHTFLKSELKVSALIIGTQIITSPPSLQATLDVVDTHRYLSHPQWPEGVPAWDPVDWYQSSTSAVASPPGIMDVIAAAKVKGKPFVVTETGHLMPNPHSSEGPLLTAAYASLQDADGIFSFAWAGGGSGSANDDVLFTAEWVSDNGDLGSSPSQNVNQAIASRMFRGFGVTASSRVFTVAMPASAELASMVDRGQAWRPVDAFASALAPQSSLLGRVEMDLAPGAVDSPSPFPDLASTTRFVSDTGELAWDVSNPAAGYVTINAAKTRAFIGFTDESPTTTRSVALGGPGVDCASASAACVVLSPGATRQRWCTMALELIEGSSFAGSGRALLTLTGDGENTGMQWTDSTKVSVGRHWGYAPTLVEVVPAKLTLPRAAGEVRVYALDGWGQRAAEVAVKDASGRAEITLGADFPTLWYEVVLGTASEPGGDGDTQRALCATYCDDLTRALPTCEPERPTCLARCAAYLGKTRTASCECTTGRRDLMACLHQAPATALSCNGLPLHVAANGPCQDESRAFDRCIGDRAPCDWTRELVDDLEDGNDRIPTTSGRHGSWWLATGGGTTGAPASFGPVAGGARESRYAARLSAVRPDGNAWAILGVTLADDQAYDLSNYDGLAFYAKGQGSVRVEVQTLDTANTGSHGEGIALGPDWEYHVVLFDDPRFRQASWSAQASFVPARATAVLFKAERLDAVDFSIDDVELLRRPDSGIDGGTPGGTVDGGSPEASVPDVSIVQDGGLDGRDAANADGEPETARDGVIQLPEPGVRDANAVASPDATLGPDLPSWKDGPLPAGRDAGAKAGGNGHGCGCRIGRGGEDDGNLVWCLVFLLLPLACNRGRSGRR